MANIWYLTEKAQICIMKIQRMSNHHRRRYISWKFSWISILSSAFSDAISTIKCYQGFPFRRLQIHQVCKVVELTSLVIEIRFPLSSRSNLKFFSRSRSVINIFPPKLDLPSRKLENSFIIGFFNSFIRTLKCCFSAEP